MPITVVCPGCSAKLNAPDAAAGKKVKCPKPGCGKLIGVPEPLPADFEEVEDNPPPKPTPKKAVKAVVEDDPQPKKKRRVESDEDEDERPKSKRRRNEEEDDEDEQPKSRRRRDEDEDDEDERPRKKKKKQKSAGLSPMLLVGIVLGGLLLLGGVGYGVYALAFKKTETAGSGGGSSGGGSGGGSSSSPKAPVPTGWVEFKPADGGFKAYFPAQPRPDRDNTDSMKIYEGEDKTSKSGCIVFVSKPPYSIVSEKRKEAGIETLNSTLSVLGAKELSRKDATMGGLAGTEIVFAEPSKGKGKAGGQGVGRAVFRVVVTDTKVYMAGVYSDTGMPKPELVDGFFDNFEIVK